MPRIALNGLGRIGKLALRDLIDTGAGGEIVLVNDPVGDAAQHALLMEFDSVHGRCGRLSRTRRARWCSAADASA
jgi:glyceraldehyde 3-phosphate dehydrogenase